MLRITTTIDDLRLREYILPMHILENGKLRQVGIMPTLRAEGGTVSERYRDRLIHSDGTQTNYDGEGTTRELQDTFVHIWKKNVNVDTTSGVGWNVPSGPGLYNAEIRTTPGKYTINGTNGPQKVSFGTVFFGRLPPTPIDSSLDTEIRFLDSTSSRMIGSYTKTQPEVIGLTHSVTVSWNICREGVTCMAPPSAARGASVSLGNLFETDLAELLAEAQLKLDGVLSKIKSDPNLMPEIRVIVKEGSQALYLDALAETRILVLKLWFAERGVDTSQITWTWETGASDQVLFASE